MEGYKGNGTPSHLKCDCVIAVEVRVLHLPHVNRWAILVISLGS